MRRSLPALLLGSALALVATRIAGEELPSNKEVERSIDEITHPPDYDWLRAPRSESTARRGKQRDRGEARKEGSSRARRSRSEGSDACGYEPQEQDGKPKRDDRAPPEGEGCSSGPTPGGEVPSEPVSGAEPSGGDCGCEPTIGDCGCDRTPGDCACDRAVGSPPGCGGVGAAGTGLGYVLGAVALGLIVFLVVRAILRRDKSQKDAGITIDDQETGPEEMRVSEVAAMPAETMMDRAIRAAAEGDFRTAVGWAYLAGISSLHRAGFTDLRVSTTNMAIISSTRRRGGPHGPAERLIRVFEELFFGGRPAQQAHWEQCRIIVEQELVHATAQ